METSMSYQSQNNASANDESAFLDSSIIRAKHKDIATVNALKNIIASMFPGTVDFYNSMSTAEYRQLVGEAQDVLNEGAFARQIVSEIKEQISEYLDGGAFLLQSNLYLRATRPIKEQQAETIGWHRESFYGPNMEKAVAVWTPIAGVDRLNTLRFIPASQHIELKDIVVESVRDGVTERFSVGHKIGFQYEPKKIVGGVDLENPHLMVVPEYSSSIFPGQLIHGSAINLSNTIRFSVDFRIMKKSHYDASLSKKFHFASGKPYFEEF